MKIYILEMLGLRIIAVAGPKQSVIPDVPSMAEAGFPEYSLYFWFATFMPAGTPGEIVARMNRDTNATVLDAKTSKSLVDAGVTPEVLSPQELATLLRESYDRWGPIVKKIGFTADS